MTFISNVGDFVAPIVVVFILAALIALARDAARAARRAALRDRRPARGAPGQHHPGAARRRAGRVRRVPLVAALFLVVNQTAGTRAAPVQLSTRPSWWRCCSAVRSRPASARSTTCSTFGRGISCIGQVALAAGAVALGVSITFVTNPFGPDFRFTGLDRRRPHDLLDRRDDQQHQLDRRPRRTVVRRGLHRGGDAGDHQPHDPGRRPAAHRRAVLRAGGFAARVPALELPPGDDLRRDQRRPVRWLHAGRAGHPRDGQGGGRPAGPRRPDHRHLLDHRPASCPSVARRSARTGRTSTTGCWTSGCRTARPSWPSTGSASCWRSSRCSCRG